MIFTKIFGGLGNQLFQYAAGRYLANKHKTDLKIFDDKWFENSNSPLAYYRLNQFNIQEKYQKIKKSLSANDAVYFF